MFHHLHFELRSVRENASLGRRSGLNTRHQSSSHQYLLLCRLKAEVKRSKVVAGPDWVAPFVRVCWLGSECQCFSASSLWNHFRRTVRSRVPNRPCKVTQPRFQVLEEKKQPLFGNFNVDFLNRKPIALALDRGAFILSKRNDNYSLGEPVVGW